MNINNFQDMTGLFNLFNELSQVNNSIEQQDTINNVIQQSLSDVNPIKHVLSNAGEKQLKYLKYDDLLFSMKECPITLSKFKNNDDIIQLPCNHIFDASGILWWLNNEQASCPICRKKLKSKEISTRRNINTTNIETNPLTLFSNINIDLSLNSQLRNPYSRDYNIEPFSILLDSIEEEDEDDDLFFLNTLQMMEDEEMFMSNFQSIFGDISNNIVNE
jgi:hypothetical protein